MLTQLNDYKPPCEIFVIFSALIGIEEIARKQGFKVERFDEYGLGDTFGALLVTPSGKTIVLKEYQHAVNHLDAKGPTVSIAASEIAKHGVDALVLEIGSALGLTKAEIQPISDVTLAESETCELVLNIPRCVVPSPVQTYGAS